jgi:hypothetical protein
LFTCVWKYCYCRNLNHGLVTRARACKVVSQDRSLGVTPHAPKSARECERNEPSHSQMNSHFGSWSPNGLSNFQKAIARVKTHWIEEFFISLESYWDVDVLNGLVWPIWISKTQVWPKEKLKVKLTIWLPITKNQESIQFPCGKVACDILLESSRRELQLFFKPHFDRKSNEGSINLNKCELEQLNKN